MKKYIRLICCFGLVLLVIACTKNSKGVKEIPTPITPQHTIRPTQAVSPTIAIGDGGLITGEPCGPPCLWGIEPGKSSKSDVYQMLTQKGLVDSCTTIDQYQHAVDQGIGGWGCSSGLDIEFKQSTKIINYIRFELTPPIMLQDIIKKHGNPNVVVMSMPAEYEYPNFIARIVFYEIRVILYFDGKYEGSYNEAKYEIEPTMLISVVVYSDSESFNESLLGDSGIPWRGYGSYP